MSQESRCPVCQARLRGARVCSRCGADLEPLMVLAVKAWRLREEARGALEAGEFERAFELAAKAQYACRTPAGDALQRLGEVISGISS